MTDLPSTSPSETPPPLAITVNGVEVSVADRGDSLLGVLRSQGLVSVKDGCSPQGQCGCCTVLVDGKPRVACVTPARRVRGREVTTLEGLDEARRMAWADALCATGGSQCGFCTPGIVMRLDGIGLDAGADAGLDAVNNALLAHLCRCTGWQSIIEAWRSVASETPVVLAGRDLEAAGRRAALEGGAPQVVSPSVALGEGGAGGGFAADTAPSDALFAVSDGEGGWSVGETLTEARRAAGKVQGRRTTVEHGWPLEVPDGSAWAASLRTTWVEPAYLETEAAWCAPGAEPVVAMSNGGAFGAKRPEGNANLGDVARRLAEQHGRPVVALASREDATKAGPKRPPVAAGMSADGVGVVRVVRTPGIVERIEAAAAELGVTVTVEEIDVAGPPTSAEIRAAGWAELVVLTAGATGVVGDGGVVRSPDGAEATATLGDDGTLRVTVACGQVLDEVVVRSYCIGAAHQAWSWLTSEALTVGGDGTVHDLTIRSFGVVRAVDTPPIEVEIVDQPDRDPVQGSDAVFVAVAAAGWLALGCRQDWPVGSPLR